MVYSNPKIIISNPQERIRQNYLLSLKEKELCMIKNMWREFMATNPTGDTWVNPLGWKMNISVMLQERKKKPCSKSSYMGEE